MLSIETCALNDVPTKI